MENTVRTAVYDATTQVLMEKGLKGLQMRFVAKQAGIATGTLYNYFKNKNDLLLYVYEKIFEDFFTRISHASGHEMSPENRLSEVVSKYFEFMEENLDLFKFLEEANIFQRSNNTVLFLHDEKCVGVFEEILKQGIKKNLFKDVEPNHTAWLFHGSIVGILRTKGDRDSFEPQKEAQNLINMFNSHLGID